MNPQSTFCLNTSIPFFLPLNMSLSVVLSFLWWSHFFVRDHPESEHHNPGSCRFFFRRGGGRQSLASLRATFLVILLPSVPLSMVIKGLKNSLKFLAGNRFGLQDISLGCAINVPCKIVILKDLAKFFGDFMATFQSYFLQFLCKRVREMT